MRHVALVAIFFSVFSAGCGSGTFILQSIKIKQQATSVSSQFTATGIYSNGKPVTPLSAAWFQWSVGSFLNGNPHYRLSSSPFLVPCGTAVTIMAVAPVDPNAPSKGTIPINVFQDFAMGKTQKEGGFVAVTTQLNCPVL